jgi:PAS domain S-box-containing protein
MQAPAIFVILRGPEHIFELVNPLYYDLVGNRQLIGKTVREALPEIVGQGFYELLDKVYNTGETFIGLEVPLSINKGKGVEQLYIDFSYQAFKNAYDESEGILVFANDVTHQVAARKKIEESEQRFRFLANAMPQKVWTANEKGEANYFNQHWIDYTGLTIEDLKGWGWKTIIHPDDWKENQERWQYSIDTGNNFELEHRFLRKDGQYCWHLSRGLPQKNENGMIVMWVGTNTDINDKKIAEQELENKVQERTKELKEANKHLERSNAELEQFAYVTSHDLQEPLRKIQFFNTVLIMRHNENLNEDAKKYIDKVTASAKRMSGLIKDLLEYSRLSKSEMQFEEVDLNKILKNVLTDFELLIAQKKAVIKTDPLPVIDGVSLQMNQLFYNLISNALKFCKKGASSEIIISVTKLSQKQKLKFSELDMQKEYYEIIFRDNGIGFNQEYGQKIFTIFEKLNDRSMFGGYGIGLAICHKIVSNHFGLIKAEGKEMEGATFTIIFPIKQR